jgi:hypothetical protein
MIRPCIVALAVCVLLPKWLPVAAGAQAAPVASVYRWHADMPNCSLEGRDDGKFLYTLNTPDAQFVLMVDGSELEKSHRTSERIFTLHLSILLVGQDPLTIRPEQVALQLVRHHGEWLSPLDPLMLARHIQEETEQLSAQADRYVEKHPDKQAAMQARLDEQKKLAAEWVEFLGKNSFAGERITALSPKTSGWFYFPSETKDVRAWKSREEFVFRIAAGQWYVEFPFALPPTDAPVLMRRRQ